MNANSRAWFLYLRPVFVAALLPAGLLAGSSAGFPTYILALESLPYWLKVFGGFALMSITASWFAGVAWIISTYFDERLHEPELLGSPRIRGAVYLIATLVFFLAGWLSAAQSLRSQ